MEVNESNGRLGYMGRCHREGDDEMAKAISAATDCMRTPEEGAVGTATPCMGLARVGHAARRFTTEPDLGSTRPVSCGSHKAPREKGQPRPPEQRGETKWLGKPRQARRRNLTQLCHPWLPCASLCHARPRHMIPDAGRDVHRFVTCPSSHSHHLRLYILTHLVLLRGCRDVTITSASIRFRSDLNPDATQKKHVDRYRVPHFLAQNFDELAVK